MIKAFAIVAGVIGAVLGFAVTLMALALVGFGNPADPIMSGLLALVVFAPAGALAGLVLGTKLGMRLRGKRSTGSLAGNSIKALAIVVAMVGLGSFGYNYYAVTTATPWLNPNAANPLLQFEIRFPAGASCRLPPTTSRSNCRPTRTICRANCGPINSVATATGR